CPRVADHLSFHSFPTRRSSVLYFFGDIDITQQILDDDFVRRFLPFEAGDPFDFDKLLDFQYALTDSDYFATVNVEPLRAQAEDRSEEHTSELQSRENLVCRLLL